MPNWKFPFPVFVTCDYCGARPGERCRTKTSWQPCAFHASRAAQVVRIAAQVNLHIKRMKRD